MNLKIERYIRSSSKKAKIEKYLFNKILIYTKDPLPEHIDLDSLIHKIEEYIPKHLFYAIDVIIVGEHEDFKKRKINALYKDGAIYVTNEQDNLRDILDDIIHELAHSNEETYRNLIYGDELLELEFIGKRKRLYHLLKDRIKGLNMKPFLNPQYSLNFDQFLLEKVGYKLLRSLTIGLFLNPYAITSLREYFATGFEEYFIGNKNNLKTLSPVLFMKLDELQNYEKGEYFI